jgi:CDP-glucose 4,6-dehydratase
MNGTAGAAYRDRTVLVTGHTGFKGSWLATWLKDSGSRVVGFALPPEAGRPSLFEAAGVADGMTSVLGDVRDLDAVRRVLEASGPEIVFHLAAQSLVRRSYRDPVETYATNVMGTAHVLEASRRCASVRAVLVVTSDKCYENRGWRRGYREDDALGGHDPYSSSKGCAEMLTSAYRRSFFHDSGPAIASARAGNVIGGGDWAEDRLVPDIVRAAVAGARVTLRNPGAVRPWQHVLDPLRGYLMLGRALLEEGRTFAEAWNFGPSAGDALSVRDLAARFEAAWDRVDTEEAESPSGPHEAGFLTLDNSKARTRLGWEPRFDVGAAVAATVDWYRRFHEDPRAAAALVREQIHEVEGRAALPRVP